MAILPDDIRDITEMDDTDKINTIFGYIQYMKEQIEFWGSKRQEEINTIKERMGN